MKRGIRNNNPGNIKKSNIDWDGEVKEGVADIGDDEFEVFIDPVYGVRAMMKLLTNYQKIHKLNSIYQIIHRWAPPSENKTRPYIDHVVKQMRVGAHQHIDLTDKATLIKLSKAIVRHENGHPPDDRDDWYDQGIYNKAARMVLGYT